MHLGIIKITYNRTAAHFMDGRFMNLGEEVKYVVFAIYCSNAEFCESCVCVCVWERERESER